MKIQKYELVRALDTARGIVQRNDAFPALGCVLIDGSSAIASSTEITIETKIEGTGSEPMLIPLRAFDMIRNFPDGEIELEQNDKHVITMKMEKLHSSFSSYPPADFTLRKDAPEGNGIVLPGEQLIEALSKVVFAVDDNAASMQIRGVNLKASAGTLTITGTDTHVAAIDIISWDGEDDMDIIIPKITVRKLAAMDIDGEIRITYDKTSAVFETSRYTVYSRLISGEYVDMARIFAKEAEMPAYTMDRKSLQAAITRAGLCLSNAEEKRPLILQFSEKILQLSLGTNTSGYAESLDIDSTSDGAAKSGYSPKLLLEAIKGYSGQNIRMKLMGQNSPAFFSDEDTGLKILVLPVKI